MLQSITMYFREILDFAHIMQLIFIAVSVVYVLTPIKLSVKAVLTGLGEIFGVFAFCILFEVLFFGLSGSIRGFGGICFPLLPH